MHQAIAAQLMEQAGEHLDEQVELLAYHYQKAVQLARMLAVPPKLEVETERAITFQVRAGELAGRSGAFAEAQNYFQNAIACASGAERIVLYEKMGDTLGQGWGWGDQAKEAYHKALELWRKEDDALPLVGARLIRKFLLRDRRFSSRRNLKQEEARALWQEGIELADQAADQDEQWRLRVFSLFLFLWWDLATDELNRLQQAGEIERLHQIAEEGTVYFAACQDWEFLSEVLDCYTFLQLRLEQTTEALAIVKQRLQFPNLSVRERSDAIGMFIMVSMFRGEYDAGVEIMSEALNALRPDEPIEYFGNVLGLTLWLLYLTGRWSEIPRFQRALNEAWKRVQEVRGAWRMLVGGYQALLCIALAREERAEVDAYDAMLYRLAPDWFKEEMMFLTSAYRDEDFSLVMNSLIELEERIQEEGSNGWNRVSPWLMLFSEHGLQVPERFKQWGSALRDDLAIRVEKIAQALDNNDNEELAQAIDEAEEHRLVVHAARMRIVLAKRIGDRSHLDRARPVLERLEDRLFLRKLREVEETLQTR